MFDNEKSTAQPKFRLEQIKLPGKDKPEEGKFRAIVMNRGSYGTDKVIDEMLDYSSLRMSPYMVESVVSGVLESMIKNTLSDGMTRRFGDYFAIRLDVKGSFDEKDAAFDPRKHSVKLSLVPLKRFRKALATRRPQNRVKPPRALMTEVRGESSAVDEVKFGENIVVKGRNLTLLDNMDRLRVYTYDRRLNQHNVSFGPDDVLDATPTQIVLPFPEEFKNVDLHPDKRYRRLYFKMFSRGGKESSEPRSVKYKHGVLIGPKA